MAAMTWRNETYHETSFPTMSAPGGNHRNRILKQISPSIHVPSEARSDEEDVSTDSCQVLKFWSAGKET